MSWAAGTWPWTWRSRTHDRGVPGIGRRDVRVVVGAGWKIVPPEADDLRKALEEDED